MMTGIWPAGTGWLGMPDDLAWEPLSGTARRDTDDAGAVEAGEAAVVADRAWQAFLGSLQRERVVDDLEDEPAD